METKNSKRKQAQERLLSLIPTGEENAVSLRFLSDALGLCIKDLKDLVLRTSLEETPIAGTNAGYYIPDGPEEWKEYRAYMKARATSTNARLKAIDRYMAKNFPQS